MRNTFFAALFVFAILGTQSLSAAPAITGGALEVGPMCKYCCEPPCCPPMMIQVYTATIKGEIKDKDAAKKIEELIKAMDGVRSVTIDIETKQATITMYEDCFMSKDEINEELKDSGFEVTELATASED